MKILAGSIVRQEPEILKAHMQTMLWQEVKGHTVEYMYVNDLDTDSPTYKEARDVLFDSYPDKVNVVSTTNRPSGLEYGVSEVTHDWNEATFQWLGKLKQDYLNTARANGFDAVFLVDSDLLMDRYTLQSLLNLDQPIVSGVFWTSWQPDAPPLPQVWQQHPYNLDGGLFREPEFLQRLHNRDAIQVGGLGACTFIRLDETTENILYYPFMPDLPHGNMWQGEDRHFCIRANRLHVPLLADGWPDIKHLYRPSDTQYIPEWLEMLGETHPSAVTHENLVSLRLQPLEIANWDGYLHLRGRLGTLKLLPEIESEVLQMPVGSSSIIKVSYPSWWPFEPFRGQSRLLKIDLLDAKYYRLPATKVEERWYTPAQMAAMKDARIHRALHQAPEADQGMDGTSQVDAAE